MSGGGDKSHLTHFKLTEENGFNYDVSMNEETDIVAEKPFFSHQLDTITVFKVGDRAVFKCPALGSPKPVITWSKNHIPINQKLVQNGELIFEQVDTSNSGIYTCTASNNAGSTSHSFQCLVYDSDNHTPHITSENITMLENSTVVLKCPLVSSFQDGDSLITWHKGSKAEVLDGNHVVESKVSSLPQLLILSSVAVDDSGVYTCALRSKTDLDQYSSVFLKVSDGSSNQTSTENQDNDADNENDNHDGDHDHKSSANENHTGYLFTNMTEEAPKFTKKSQMLPAMVKPAGNMVRMKCPASGNPVPNITWHKNDRTPFNRNLGTIRYSRWQIMLEDLVTSDTGNYTCVVCNIHGCINFTYKLEVLGKSFFS